MCSRRTWHLRRTRRAREARLMAARSKSAGIRCAALAVAVFLVPACGGDSRLRILFARTGKFPGPGGGKTGVFAEKCGISCRTAQYQLGGERGQGSGPPSRGLHRLSAPDGGVERSQRPPRRWRPRDERETRVERREPGPDQSRRAPGPGNSFCGQLDRGL